MLIYGNAFQTKYGQIKQWTGRRIYEYIGGRTGNATDRQNYGWIGAHARIEVRHANGRNDRKMKEEKSRRRGKWTYRRAWGYVNERINKSRARQAYGCKQTTNGQTCTWMGKEHKRKTDIQTNGRE